MKKLLLTLMLFTAFALVTKAQKTVKVHGTITNPLAGQKIWIVFNSTPSGCSVYDSTTTNSSGNFTYTLNIGAGCANNGVLVYLVGCKSMYDTLSLYNHYDTTKSKDSIYYSFKYCDTCKTKANWNDSNMGFNTYFNNLSTNANKYLWKFGDGTSSTAKNPNHTYSKSGFYTVCLIATDSISGCKDSLCKTVQVNKACIGFTVNFKDSLLTSNNVKFTNLSSASANKFTWKFGDGTTSTAKSPTHIYGASGTYTVCLIAKDTINNCIDSICKNVTVVYNPCTGFTANFKDSTTSGNTKQFTSLSSGSANKFTWKFGDGTSSTSQNPSHTYSAAGTYTVCLIAKDTIKNCTDSICKTITVGSSSPCIGFAANFKDSTTSGNTKQFTSLSSGSANKFTWKFGDGNTSTAKNPSHTYSAAGTYTVCLIARDTLKNCVDSICKSITVNPCAGFTASYSHSISCTSVAFTNTTTGANKFAWSFGDGSSTNAENPTRGYPSSGTYTVCLIAKDTLKGCSDTVCKNITVVKTLSGHIYRDSGVLADSGMVWLIKVTIDTLLNDTILTAVDSTVFIASSGQYFFNNPPAGNYLIKAALFSWTSYYSTRIPTYHAHATQWNNATVHTVGSSCTTADILLVTGTNPGGPGFVGGRVSMGANKTGDPLAERMVLLFNANNSVAGFTYTDANGNYSFSNLAFGTYSVQVEVMDKLSEKYIITIDAQNLGNTNGNFDENTKNITLSKTSTTGINAITMGTKNLYMYPNPAQNLVNLTFDATIGGNAGITITDVTGKLILTKVQPVNSGANETQLEVSNLENGVYILTIVTGDSRYVGRLSINR